MDCYNIIAIRVAHRVQDAPTLQQVLTNFGCHIKARLGLHETSSEQCANDGIIILQVCGTDEQLGTMLASLTALDGVTAKLVDLN